jgi:hypothetical protein
MSGRGADGLRTTLRRDAPCVPPCQGPLVQTNPISAVVATEMPHYSTILSFHHPGPRAWDVGQMRQTNPISPPGGRGWGYDRAKQSQFAGRGRARQGPGDGGREVPTREEAIMRNKAELGRTGVRGQGQLSCVGRPRRKVERAKQTQFPGVGQPVEYSAFHYSIIPPFRSDADCVKRTQFPAVRPKRWMWIPPPHACRTPMAAFR